MIMASRVVVIAIIRSSRVMAGVGLGWGWRERSRVWVGASFKEVLRAMALLVG